MCVVCQMVLAAKDKMNRLCGVERDRSCCFGEGGQGRPLMRRHLNREQGGGREGTPRLSGGRGFQAERKGTQAPPKW